MCGLDYDTVSPQDAVVAVRSFPRRYRGLLATPGPTDAPDAVFRRRPDATTWSALEYTAHVADRLDHLGPSVRRIVYEDHPSIDAFDGDDRAVEHGYNALDRTEVLGWLDIACAELASVLEEVPAGDWTRPGIVAGVERDTIGLARDGVHEGSHHLRDVQRVLAAVRGRP